MNKHLAKYEDKRIETNLVLKDILKFYNDNGYVAEAAIINDFIEMLSREEFSIVIVGEFSVGKSTFLNALMGEKILPSYSDETTATVTFLRHKGKADNQQKGRVYYADGSCEDIDSIETDVISRYVSTRSDIPVAATVNHLDLFLDSSFLEGNITLVDTPGLNGTADGHREITEAQIMKSNVCLFMFSADRPGGKSEFEFLSQIKTKANKIIFVLNKIDQIRNTEDESYEKVAENMLKNFGKIFPDAEDMPEFWCVSSYQALVARASAPLAYRGRKSFSDEDKYRLLKMSRMEEFEDGLWHFITEGDKARNSLMVPISKASKMVDETLKNLELECSIYESAVDNSDAQQIINELNQKISETEQKMNKLKSRIYADINKCMENALDFTLTKVRLFRGRQFANLESFQTTEELIELEKSLPSIINNGVSAATFELKEKLLTDISNAVGKYLPDLAESVRIIISEYEFNICPDCKYFQTENSFELGIEQYQDGVNRLTSEINIIQSEIDTLSVMYMKSLRAEKERARLKLDIERLKEEKQQYENGLEKPKVKRVYTKEEKSRFSLFGLFRKKKLVETTEYIDDTETRAWKKEVEDRLSDYAEQIRLKTLEYNAVEYIGKPSSELNEEIHMKSSILSELHKQLDERRAGFKDRYVKENIALYLKKKMYIEAFYNEGMNSYANIAAQELQKFLNDFTQRLEVLFTNDLSRRFDLINKNIDALKHQLSLTMDEKTNKIKNINRQIGLIKSLYCRIEELKISMNSDTEKGKIAI
ncbi:MAG: dynamin family protein [Oscillospiraceae bacterium]|nr:dynamin family protein [Oscillospiraceae bacterium]